MEEQNSNTNDGDSVTVYKQVLHLYCMKQYGYYVVIYNTKEW